MDLLDIYTILSDNQSSPKSSHRIFLKEIKCLLIK